MQTLQPGGECWRISQWIHACPHQAGLVLIAVQQPLAEPSGVIMIHDVALQNNTIVMESFSIVQLIDVNQFITRHL